MPFISGKSIQRAGVAVCLLVLAGCPAGTPDAPSAAKFKVTAEGTGPTNSAPLDPQRDGTYRGGLMVDGTVELPTGRARRVVDSKTSYVTYLLDTKTGVFVAGSTLDGVLENPVLLVPATVRVGMKWEVTLTGEDPAYTFSVDSRVEADTVWGKNSVTWTIVQTDAAGKNTERAYVEGVGIASTGWTIVNLDSPDPEPTKAPKVAVQAIATAADSYLPPAMTQLSVSMVRAPGHDPLILWDALQDQGTSAQCWKIGATEATAVGPMKGTPQVELGPEDCPAMAMVGTDAAHTTVYVGSHAGGAYVVPDGHIRWTSRVGGLLASSAVPAVTNAMAARALFPGTDGGVDMLYEGGSPMGEAKFGGLNYFTGYEGIPSRDVYVPDTFFALGIDTAFISPITTDEGDRYTLLIRTFDDMLWLARVTEDGMTVPTRVGRLAGGLSVQATEKGHEILRVFSDGFVDRLHVSGGKLTLEPLANVTLPPSMSADAAFLVRDPAGDKLVLALYDFTKLAADRVERLYRSTQAVVASSERRAVAPQVSLSSAGGNGDVLVCLPPADQGVTTTGWTLGGAPAGLAVEVSPGSRCVLVVRGPGQTTAPQGEPFPAVSGSFPGLGRVAMTNAPLGGGQPNAYALGAAHILAPLKGGGVAHPSRKYGRGLVAIEPSSLAARPISGGMYGDPLAMWYDPPLIDPRGDGLWAMRKSFGPDGFDVMRFGKSLFHHTYPTGTAIELKGMSQKGGVLAYAFLTTGTDYAWFRLTSDGGQTPLADAPMGVTYCTELSDGTLCGDLWNPSVSMQHKYACTTPGGATRTGAVAVSSGLEQPCRGATVLLDGSMLIVGFHQVFRFDPATMTTALYFTGDLWMGVGSDGSAFGVTVAADGALTLYRLTPDAPVMLTQPGDYAVSPQGIDTHYQVVVDDDVIGIHSGHAELHSVRIPHPAP